MPKVKVTVRELDRERVLDYETEKVMENLHVLKADFDYVQMDRFRAEWERIQSESTNGNFILILPKDSIWESSSIEVDDPRYFDIDSLNFAAVRVALSEVLQENAGASKYMADRLANLFEPVLRALQDSPAYKATQAAEEDTEDGL